MLQKIILDIQFSAYEVEIFQPVDLSDCGQIMQLSVHQKYFSLEKQMLKEIFSVGLSAMFLDILLVVSSLMFNYYAVKYGDYVWKLSF